MPKFWDTDVHKAEVNCAPRLDVMFNGTPKRAIHELIRARTCSLDEGSFNGLVSGQRVYLSMIMNRLLNPLEGGRGLTRSTWMWLNRFSSKSNLSEGAWIYLCILAHWQTKHSVAHWMTYFFRLCHIDFPEIRCCVVFFPGCAKLGTLSNT